MKLKLSLLFYCFSFIACSQLRMDSVGPVIDNDQDVKLQKMLGADDNYFYNYRVRYKGKGTSYYLEKCDRKKLSPVFLKELNMKGFTCNDIYFLSGSVYVFRSKFNEPEGKFTLWMQQFNSNGDSLAPVEIVTLPAAQREFYDIDVLKNPSATRFGIKICYKDSGHAAYKTKFIVIDPKQNLIETRAELDAKLVSEFYTIVPNAVSLSVKDILDCFFDDNDNFVYINADTVRVNDTTLNCKLYMQMVNRGTQSKKIDLPFNDNYRIEDLKITQSPNGNIIACGFVKEIIQKKGRDKQSLALMFFKVDAVSATLLSHKYNFVSEAFLNKIGTSLKYLRKNLYLLHNIYTTGDDVYMVGQEHEKTYMYGSGFSGTDIQITYKSIIAAKINAKGEFAWVTQTPAHNLSQTKSPLHVYKMYISFMGDSNLYVMNNENILNEGNFNANTSPDLLEANVVAHGSNCMGSTIHLTSGKVAHYPVFYNKKYCFKPNQVIDFNVPPSDIGDVYLKVGNRVYLYTEDGGNDKYVIIKYKN